MQTADPNKKKGIAMCVMQPVIFLSANMLAISPGYFLGTHHICCSPQVSIVEAMFGDDVLIVPAG